VIVLDDIGCRTEICGAHRRQFICGGGESRSMASSAATPILVPIR
jgi:hypothetical protein